MPFILSPRRRCQEEAFVFFKMAPQAEEAIFRAPRWLMPPEFRHGFAEIRQPVMRHVTAARVVDGALLIFRRLFSPTAVILRPMPVCAAAAEFAEPLVSPMRDELLIAMFSLRHIFSPLFAAAFIA